MNKSKPLVSVVIPTYNGSKYIWRAIESVLMQNFPDYEIVISDNCSTDNTREIVLDYIKKYGVKIKYYRNNENIGYPANLRKLIYELSQGEYIAILCDDDYYCDRNALSYCVDVLEKNSNVGFVFSKFDIKTEESEFTMELCDKSKNKIEALYDIEKGENFFLNFGEYINKGYPLLSTLFIRRSIAEESKIFTEDNFKYCPDLIAVQKMLLITDAARINRKLVVYSWRPSNLSHQFKINEMFREEIRSVDYVYSFAKEKGIQIDKLNNWRKKEKDRHASGKVYHVFSELERGYLDISNSRKIMKTLFLIS